MKINFSLCLSFVFLSAALVFNSCKKENLFRSEAEIKKSLEGTWNLIPIPKFDTIRNPDNSYYLSEHVEKWVFTDARVDINLNTVSGYSAFTVNTSATKVELKLSGVSLPLNPDRYNGTWQVVRLDDDILSIANEKEGTGGLLYLEFQKKK
jgi:hypothetical protein